MTGMRDPSSGSDATEIVNDMDVMVIADGYWGINNKKAHAINYGPAFEGDTSKKFLDKGANVWPGQMARNWGPSSQHPGGQVTHVFADNHTQTISDKIDSSVYYRLISRNKGEPIPSELE
jgi:hypothetical protein